MQFDPTAIANIPYVSVSAIAAPPQLTNWMRIWDGLPPQNVVVPVWDGDYLYYATYWEKDGQQFWMVANQIISDDGDMDLRKKAGEQVYPIQWLKIEAPTT